MTVSHGNQGNRPISIFSKLSVSTGLNNTHLKKELRFKMGLFELAENRKVSVSSQRARHKQFIATKCTRTEILHVVSNNLKEKLKIVGVGFLKVEYHLFREEHKREFKNNYPLSYQRNT
ncbi:hypothetical protein RF11_12348 [Thelohanellus kitauei]|uniref:Uncharacterized protein n=1 Tax=Thelohanellus kitauei TaxID=669202 RepID=A0A0C2NFT5_THEKT|nr:hypothetical protein RF11_12348 [Thelohanellus kitauei]